jgi:peptide/nickel transport system substrate-binding protein
LDVNSATDQVSAAASLYNGLIALQPPDFLTIGPDLAESWSVSTDGKTYTFKLVPGVVNHLGHPWTAKDAKFTLDLLTQKTASRPPHAYVTVDGKSVFESIEAPDDTTLVVKLKQVDSLWFPQMAQPEIAMFTQADYDEKTSKDKPVGTGPFRLARHLPQEILVYEANPGYFRKGVPYLAGFETHIIADTATIHAALEAKRIDLIMMGGSEGANERNTSVIEGRYPGQITRYSGIHPVGRGILFNFRADGPWKEKKVRQAINLALSRDDICAVIPNCYIGDWMPSPKWGSKDREALAKRPGFAKKGPAKDAEINRAQELMAEAGYAKGFAVRSICRSEVDYKDYWCPMAEFLLRDLLGIRMTIELNDRAVHTEKLDKGDWLMRADAYGGMRVDHPYDWLDVNVYCGQELPNNATGYCNQEYNDLLVQLRTAGDAETRRISDRILDIFYDEVPGVLGFWSNRWVMHWNYVKNVPDQRYWGGYTQSRRLEYVWLDK